MHLVIGMIVTVAAAVLVKFALDRYRAKKRG